METPLISIFVLCYNSQQTLPRTLEAIKRQTCRNFELILVDNGSHDESFNLSRQFRNDNPDIQTTVLRLEQNNMREAVEQVLKTVKGTYLLKNDSDDWMEPDCIELLAQKALETDADIVAGLYQEVTLRGIRRKRTFSKNPSRWTIVVEQGRIYKKELFVLIPTQYTLFGDLYLTIQLNSVAKTVAFVNKVIFNFFLHNDSNFNAKKYDFDTKLNMNKNITETYAEAYAKETVLHEKNTICYAATKKTYEFIILGIRDKTIKNKETVLQFLNNLKAQFPTYRKNPAIKLTDNGYCFRARLAFYAVYLIDRFNLWNLLIFYYSHKRI